MNSENELFEEPNIEELRKILPEGYEPLESISIPLKKEY